jgi:predicted nucleic acid-binding protein
MDPSRDVAVDSSVLLDVLLEDQSHAEVSRRALNTISKHGPLILSSVVLSEISVHFKDRDKLRCFLNNKPLSQVESNDDVAWWASRFFRRYVRERGANDDKVRKKITPDFFIAGHARVHADGLLTRDQDFHLPCFDDLKIVNPSDV